MFCSVFHVLLVFISIACLCSVGLKADSLAKFMTMGGKAISTALSASDIIVTGSWHFDAVRRHAILFTSGDGSGQDDVSWLTPMQLCVGCI